jgi:hypothetical protein
MLQPTIYIPSRLMKLLTKLASDHTHRLEPCGCHP